MLEAPGQNAFPCLFQLLAAACMHSSACGPLLHHQDQQQQAIPSMPLSDLLASITLSTAIILHFKNSCN